MGSYVVLPGISCTYSSFKPHYTDHSILGKVLRGNDSLENFKVYGWPRMYIGEVFIICVLIPPKMLSGSKCVLF
jgi:hypothetical protein